MKIVLLNAATLPVYYPELAHLLLDALHSGASLGYPRTISRQEAESLFYALRSELEKGERLLWIARDEQGVVGCISLQLPLQSEALNRGNIKLLLVHRRARRTGIGKKLLTEVEKTAWTRQRGLLSLEVQAGSVGEAFYRSQGYRCLGEMPDFLGSSDGYYHPAAIFFKRLFAVNQTVRSIAS
ncbi:GNAT family N-acetyltransferase [Enterobacter sp. Bisph1]|uniref:GNAT family N-acetyltransferase n=1 Tax=Enterobacter sp. Bisph1 TaxID=1274399 RepID=UPI00057BE88D|nr:GNAT family N-acetyltransferase [Enterobacter sp. Bisph1]